MRHRPLLIPVVLAGIVLSTAVANAAGVRVIMRGDTRAASEVPRSDIEPPEAAGCVDFIPRTLAETVDTIERLAAAPGPTSPAEPKSTSGLSDPTITDGIADHEMRVLHPSDYDPPKVPFARLLLAGTQLVEAMGASRAVYLPEPSCLALLVSGGAMLAGWLARRKKLPS